MDYKSIPSVSKHKILIFTKNHLCLNILNDCKFTKRKKYNETLKDFGE